MKWISLNIVLIPLLSQPAAAQMSDECRELETRVLGVSYDIGKVNGKIEFLTEVLKTAITFGLDSRRRSAYETGIANLRTEAQNMSDRQVDVISNFKRNCLKDHKVCAAYFDKKSEHEGLFGVSESQVENFKSMKDVFLAPDLYKRATEARTPMLNEKAGYEKLFAETCYGKLD